MPERRQQTRHLPEKNLSVYNQVTGEKVGLLANFSSEGIMLISRDKIPTSTDLKLRIELLQPILNKSEIIIEANCCWTRLNIHKKWWESGFQVQATGINKELLEYLSIAFVVGKWRIPGVMDVKTTPVENLRKTLRYIVKDEYPVYQQQSYHEIGKMVNLSIAGSSLISPKEIKKGSILKCKVKLPKTIFQSDYLLFEGECRWSKRDEESGMYKSGYKFQNISDHDKVIIIHLIMYYLEEQRTKKRIRVLT